MWDTLCTFFPLWAFVFSLSSGLFQSTSPSLNTEYHITSFSYRARTLCVLLHCLSASWSPHNHHCLKIQVRIFCLLCIWYGGVYFSRDVYCWSHGWMDGVYSLLCKTTSVSSSWQRDVFTMCPFEQLVQHVFWNRGISLQVRTVVAVYTVCCITPFF